MKKVIGAVSDVFVETAKENKFLVVCVRTVESVC